MWDVLVGKSLDSKAKIKKRKDFTHSKHMLKEFVLECSCLSHHVNPDLAFDNYQYLWQLWKVYLDVYQLEPNNVDKYSQRRVCTLWINIISFTTVILVWDITIRSPGCSNLTNWKVTFLTALSTLFYLECVLLTKQYHFKFLCLSDVLSI